MTAKTTGKTTAKATAKTNAKAKATARTTAPRRIVVVPCFNEALRLDVDALLAMVDDDTGLLLVDDGSGDATLVLLQAAAARDPGHVRVLARARNGGKAEAVRAGLNAAIDAGADVVGYLDADLSTPVDEMRRILDTLDCGPALSVVMGARVALLGRDVRRSASRHYLGRAFATVASLSLGLRVYDTQCGAKAFRVGAPLRQALRAPFTSRWAFDVELLARLLESLPPDAFFELPLARWIDVGGSKLGAGAMIRAGLDVVGIGLRRR